MTTLQEAAMRKALEYIEGATAGLLAKMDAIESLSTALAQQGEQQPVAWYDEEFDCAYTSAELDGGASDWLIPLYTAAPAPQPKGLFIDMITEHGPEFVAEIAAIGETAPQPAQGGVTRRMGWLNLKAGDLFQPVKKCMGLKPGQKIEKLGQPVRVVSVRREPLNWITLYDCRREGFPQMTGSEFVAMFCATHKGCTPATEITRIEFSYEVSP